VTFSLVEEATAGISELIRIPIAFVVDRVFDVGGGGDSGDFSLSERMLDVPYAKDYDLISGENPRDWAKRYDLANWGLIGAYANGDRVGAAAIAFNTAGVTMLEGRTDLAVLWDIRVAPTVRHRGIGSALFRAVEAWAIARRCRELKIETQNINVPACRFYAAHGCALRRVNRSAYPTLPGEVQLLWYKALRASTAG
jgi:GNAT superfamily N-acetyltransferase